MVFNGRGGVEVDLVGLTLGGRYRILAKLGAGGMAIVYKAEDTLLNRVVAVKVLRSPYAEDDDFIRRFRQEARNAAALSHPNIVNIYDVGQEQQFYYIVMEYVDGQTLEEKIRRENRLSPPAAVQIAVQIAGALQHAHQRGIVHRDIKPHNIILTGNDRVKVTDFGIARATTGSTIVNTGSILGSAHYFSPEQARGGYVDEKSDLYSLGVVIYEMLTGQVPFQGDSPISVAIKHLQEGIVPPRELFPDIPLRLEAVVMRAMEKEQARRYPSASSLLMDLLTALRTVPADSKSQVYVMPRAGPEAVAKISVQQEESGASSEPRPGRMAASNGTGPPEAGGKPGKGKGSGRFAYLLPALLGVVFLVALGVVFNAWINAPTVTVPNVVGKSVGQAESLLREAGLQPKVGASRPDSRIRKGDVLSQDPATGDVVKRGREVNLVVSGGVAMFDVPDVTGQDLAMARVNLVSANLAVGKISYRNSISTPAGSVISQSPHGGAKAPQGAMVKLVVSNGPPSSILTLPDLTGQTLGNAEAIIKDLGLYVGSVMYQNDPSAQFGTVLSQSPVALSQVQSGSSVNLVLSQGQGAASDSHQGYLQVVVPTSAPPNSTVSVEVDDQTGSNVVYTGSRGPGDSFSVNFVWFGSTGQIRVYLNGSLLQSSPLTPG